MSKTGENQVSSVIADEEVVEEYCATCRPCCTLPFGGISLVTAIAATIGSVFAVATMLNCHFMAIDFTWCTTPNSLYGTCGDCHCIITEHNGTCPTGDAVPQQYFYKETLDQWKALKLLNPYNITCNPYTNKTCEATPPQQYIELWEDAVCGVKYVNETRDAVQCPTEYYIESYPNISAMEADGAELTHWGSCGTCSSLQDLAVYAGNPDLTGLGQLCGIIGLVDNEAGIQCFMGGGYTRECATMWMYNVFNTRDKCLDICLDFTFDGDPNNGPPPECEIADCLQCDEDESGPIFKKVAARARRRAGLLSKIARPCKDILIVNHKDPCPNRSGTTPALQDPQPQCIPISNDAGLLRYASKTTKRLFDISFLQDRWGRLSRTYFDSCERYVLGSAREGFWKDFQDLLGAAWGAAATFGGIASILGPVSTTLTWTSTCAAFKSNFWLAMAISFGICSLFDFLTLIFFASDVCKETEFNKGCEWRSGASFPIVAGIFFAIAAVCAMFTRKTAKPGRTIGCCCCPHWESDFLSVQQLEVMAKAASQRCSKTTPKEMESLVMKEEAEEVAEET